MAVTNDVIKTVSKESGLPTFRVRAYLKGLTENIGAALRGSGNVVLPEFGSFRLLRLPARQVRAV